MFIVTADPQFTHTVKVRVPVDGGFREETVNATYRVVPIEELEGFDLSSTDGSTAFLKRAIARLDDLVDEAKKPVDYSDELRDRIINTPFVRVALVRDYFAATGGVAKGN